MNLKYVNDVNTAAFETELVVFYQVFQEDAGLFNPATIVTPERSFLVTRK